MIGDTDNYSELCKLARGAHQSGVTAQDNWNAVYSAVLRSVGLDRDMEAWSIRKTNEILERSGISNE